MLVVDRDACRLYETYDSHPNGDGSWSAGSGAVFDLRSNRLRPAGWTSADAAGLPILAGLVRYDEVAAGKIDHAIRVTVPESQKAYVWPARHQAGSSTDPDLPPMGLRLRLKAGFDISGFDRQARIVLQAAEDLRADRGRQRLALVHVGRPRRALGQRRAPHPAATCPARPSRRSTPQA